MYFKALIRLESFSFTQIVSLSLLFITTESLEIEKRRSHLINLLMEVYHSFLFFKIFFFNLFILAVLGLHLEKSMAPRSSTFAWRIPWMEEPGGLRSMGSLRVGHD